MFNKNAEVYVTTAQEREMLACREMYREETLIPVSIIHEFEPLEETRFYGPFSVEVLAWVKQMTKEGIAYHFGYDADGREYLQY